MDTEYSTTLPNRKRLRRKGADYSDCGSYFITLCIKERKTLLWDMTQAFALNTAHDPLLQTDGFQPVLSRIGEIVQEAILRIPTIYQMVIVDLFSIMPDHVHLILSIRPDENGMKVSSTSIPRIIKQFKHAVTTQATGAIWQKSYYDRILRNAEEYGKACEYIHRNPVNWRNEYLGQHDMPVWEDEPCATASDQ